MNSRTLLLSSLVLLAACKAPPAPPSPPGEDSFPSVERPVAEIVSAQFSDEESREQAGEARRVMDLMGIAPGSIVADIGAGRGYYTVNLSRRVGDKGRVYAEDIFDNTVNDLRGRVHAAGFANVSVVLGTPGDPKLPATSLDRVLLVHMYHEIENPYELLWNLRTSLKPDALVGIVDADRPTRNHGTPPWLVDCEVQAIGFERQALHELDGKSYLAVYAATKPRPRPIDIQPCRSAP
ncbi:class I SAM-dependent methyltransferase [Sphingosinicella microcystinivorans]|uniref:Methyltransferase family protein n=1 Tax=Sphingosinicella microcystinivorans TaxID=335406 RepID=A0AAD1D549_SPHMI|nr:methyltransferase domain-containing protein [Sphingosinicella microcystinivorans]RKS90672.1 methyltransferase family protein [Sphingosinicella microcystinivorans]BBE33587.1 methyltransferase type 11 [Sphingosinicella microcystinivorans]